MNKVVRPNEVASRSGNSKKSAKRRPGIMLLEPRVMYDGAAHHGDHHHAHTDGAPATGAPAQTGAPTTELATPPNGTNPSGHNYGTGKGDWSNYVTSLDRSGLHHGDNVVFVDSTIADYQAIVAAINPGTKVFVFDGTQDGLQQIAADLQGVRGLASIDIISHGATDQVQVGTDTLNMATLSSYSADLAAIGNALGKNGQLDLYGCNVAAAGDGFIDAIKQATGRNVAASTDATGAAALGANWKLEATTGPTPDALPANLTSLQSFDDVLATPTVTQIITLTPTTGDADHDGGISPGDTVTAAVTITNTGTTPLNGVTLSEALNGLTALPTGITVTPIAVNDIYSVAGNIPLTVDAAHGLLANDIDFNGQTPTFGVFTSGVTGGTVSVNTDGSFTFTPTTGFAGVASFTYLVQDAAAGNSDQSATVTFNVSAPTWYVNGTTGSDGTGTGTLANPFATIEKAVTTAANDTAGGNGVNNIIQVETAGNYSGAGIRLANGEQLLGDGSTFTVSSGNAVTLGSGNTISNISIKDTGTGSGIIDGGSSVSTLTTPLTLSNVDVSTVSGNGISLTHGGTVVATGTNSLSTGSGIALVVTGTNIGAAGLTFHDISDNGGAEGIVLNVTGPSGGLTVTGDGTTVGSGGLIQNTGEGAVFTSTSNVSLSNMNFTNADTANGTVTNNNDSTFNSGADAAINMSNVSTVTFTNLHLSGGVQVGINGQNVSNLSILNSVVSGFGNAVSEGDVELWNLTGVSNFDNSTFNTPADNAVDIRNDPTSTNTLVLNIVGSTFSSNVGSTFGADGLALTTLSGATLSVNISDSTFTGLKTAGIDTFAEGNSTMNVNITNGGVTGDGNTFTPGTGDEGRAIGLNVQDTAQLNYDIENNIAIKGNGGPVLEIFSKDSGSSQGRIDNNADIENNGTSTAANGGPNSAGSPVFIFIEDSSKAIVDISNNTINNSGEDANLDVNVQQSATLDANITGNHINLTGPNLTATSNPTPSYNDAILLVSGVTNTDTSTLFANLQNNIVTGIKSSGNINVALVDEHTGGPGSNNFFEGFAGSLEATWNARGNTPDSVLDAGGGASPGAIPGTHNGGNVVLPANLSTAPTLTTPVVSGTDLEGNTLSATAATGDVDVSSVSYQWQENFGSGFVNIAGATTRNYTLLESDVGATLRIVATSTDSDGNGATSTSAATATIGDHLTLTQPSITGTTVVGQILSAIAPAPTSDNPDATITYQWQRNGVDIPGADGQTYRLTAADVGDTIDVVATATDLHLGTIAETSAATPTVTAFTPLTLPLSIGTLPGSAQVTVKFEATVNAQSEQVIVNPTSVGTLSGSNFTTATSGTVTTTLDGLTLGGEIFNDANSDGLLDNGEAGISGVTVKVFAQGGSTALETTTTDAGGNYAFTNLAAGNYFVEVTQPAGFANASPVVDTTPNDYSVGTNYGLPVSSGVVSTNVITIAYDAPHPTGATTVPGDDTTHTLDVGFVKAPQIAGAGTTVQFYQSATALLVDNGLTVTDGAGVNIASATITITDAGTVVAGDTLAFTSQFGINGTYDGTTGVLALSGPATAAQYQTVLDSLTYSFSGDPTLAGTEHVRTVTYTVTDANANSSTSPTTTIDTFALPVVSVGGAAAPTVNSSSGPVVADSTISVTDFNGTTLAGATVVISAGAQTGDTLTDDGISTLAGGIVPGTANIHAVFSGDTLTLSGTDTVANYNIALEEVKFNATNPHSGARTLTWTVDDEAGGHINDGSATTTANAAFGPDLTAGPAVNSVEGSSTGTITVATFTDSTLTSPTVGDFTATIQVGDTTSSTGTVVARGWRRLCRHRGAYLSRGRIVPGRRHRHRHQQRFRQRQRQRDGYGCTAERGECHRHRWMSKGVTAATLNATFSDGNTAAPASDFSGTVTPGRTARPRTSPAATRPPLATAAAFGEWRFQHLYAEDGNDTTSA